MSSAMHLTIESFRGFKNVGDVHIAPLTILIGENSAGKTSMLAAIRFIYELFVSPETASFNIEPFLLGAFDQIAHFRGGRPGRTTSFSFKITSDVTISREDYFIQEPSKSHADAIERVGCTFEFVNEFSVPALSRIILEYSGKFVSIERNESEEITIKTQNFEKSLEEDPFQLTAFNERLKARNLIYMLNDLAYTTLRTGAGSKRDREQMKKLDLISVRFRSLRRQMRNAVYSSAPVRTEPGRAYTPIDASPSPQGSHIPYFLARLKRHDQSKWDALKSQIDSFCIDSGMFNKIDVKNLGRSESDPFQIYFDFGGPKRNIIDIGYGVSQVLPLITEVMSRDISTKFLFQQPEVHLHPQAQAALGTFFVTETARGRHTFILESHSDYIIDRVRMAVRDKIIKPSDVSLLYFSRNRLESEVHQIDVDESGNILNTPDGYRKFFMDEERRSLGI